MDVGEEDVVAVVDRGGLVDVPVAVDPCSLVIRLPLVVVLLVVLRCCCVRSKSSMSA